MQNEVRNKIDDNIVLRCMNGDEIAFKEIYTEYYNRIYFQAYLMLQNKEASVDIVQDTFITVFKQINNLQEPKAFHNWIKKIAYHKTLDFIRKNKKQVNLTNEEIDSFYASNISDAKKNTNMEDSLVKEYVIKAILNLTPSLKSVALLYFYEGLKVEEIAEVLHISANLVSVRINRAKKQMKQFLQEKEVTPSIYRYDGFIPYVIPAIGTWASETVFSIEQVQLAYTSLELATGTSLLSASSLSNSASIATKAAVTKGIILVSSVLAGVVGATYFTQTSDQVDVVSVRIKEVIYNKEFTNKPVEVSVEADGNYDYLSIDGEKGNQIMENGKYVIQIMGASKVLDQKEIEIKNIDRTPPQCIKREVIGTQIILGFQDELSSIDKDSIMLNGSKQGFYFDELKQEVIIDYDMLNNLHLEVSDLAGNYTDVLIDMVEE